MPRFIKRLPALILRVDLVWRRFSGEYIGIASRRVVLVQKTSVRLEAPERGIQLDHCVQLPRCGIRRQQMSSNPRAFPLIAHSLQRFLRCLLHHEASLRKKIPALELLTGF